MGVDPSFPFYASDWLGSNRVALMTLAEQGAFVQLLCRMWSDPDCSLPDNAELLAKLSLLGPDWAAGSGETIHACFVPHPDKPSRLTHPKMLRARQDRDIWREKSRFGGKKSAAGRAAKLKGGSTTLGTVVEPPLQPPYQPNGQPNGQPPAQPNGKLPLPLPLPLPFSSPCPSPLSEEKKTGRAGASRDDVLAVFAHYRQFHSRACSNPQSDSKEWRYIVKRMAEGSTVGDLCAAIDGCHRSPFHLGENESGQRHVGLELIMRDAKHVQQFIEMPYDATVLSLKSQKTKRAGQNFLEKRMGAANGEA